MPSIRAHHRVAKSLQALPPAQRKKLDWWLHRLREDPTLGQQVPHRQIPASLRALMQRPNLWRLPLPEGWRALYSLQTHEDRDLMVLILWLGPHTAYDRLFGYR